MYEDLFLKLNKLTEKTKKEDYSLFEQNMIRMFNIEYKTYLGKLQLLTLTNDSILTNYYAGSQYVILKKYYEKINNIKFNYLDLIEKIVKIPTFFISRKTFIDTDILDIEDRRMIYNNMNKLLSIIDIIYPKYKDDEDLEYAIESFKEYDIGILSNKKNAIENVKRKFIFDMLGLQDFVNNDLDNYLLTKDDIKDEGIKIMEDYFGEKEFTRILKK